MTRAEALKKLLALGPLSKDEAYVACGWSMPDFEATLAECLKSGDVRLGARCTARQVRTYRVAA